MNKRKLFFFIGIAVMFTAMLSRCAKDIGTLPKASNTLNCDTITYDVHISSIMNAYCVSCHGDPLSGGAPVYLNTYTSVKTSADNGSLKKTTIDEATMPYGGPPLSAKNQNLISCWLNNGKKESISYTNTIKPIMDKFCVNCHGTPLSGGAPVHLDSYSSVKTSAENGTLKKTVITDGSMPYGGPPLSQADKDLISFWLNHGLKE